MSGLLSIASTGLNAAQAALTTTGHNIANVNTPGFSRQTVALATMTPQKYGPGYLGTGVDVTGINRVANGFVNQQLLASTSDYHAMYTYFQEASRMDNSLGDAKNSISTGIQDFFSSLQQVAETPDNVQARSIALNQSQLLVNRFQTLDNQFKQHLSEVNNEIADTVQQINSIGNQLAEINLQISGSGVISPDLHDAQDNLLNKLSALVSVTSYVQNDGSLNVIIGQGQSLVIAGESTPLVTIPNSLDPTHLDVAIDINNTMVTINPNMTGGALGGLTSMVNELITPIQNELGRVALSLNESLNKQHHLGIDANGQLGQNYFTDINSTTRTLQRVFSNDLNQGSAVLSLSISDSSQLTSDNYKLLVQAGPNYILTNLTTNTSTNFSSFPINHEGFTLDSVSGTANNGDTFLLVPTRNGASDLSLNITDQSQLATALPVRVSTGSSNTGSGALMLTAITDTTTPIFATPLQLSPPLRIEFLSATSYQLVNASSSAVLEGPITYDPNSQNSLFPTPLNYDPGMRATLSGAIASGDRFTLEYNTGGRGDNRNALQLASLQNTGLLANGTETYQQAYAALVSEVGIKTHEADLTVQTNQAILQQAQARRDSISGVNLDEEAANLLQYQQMYSALGRLMAVANSMFDTLFKVMN
jgi:flagellar hook-associated protein 1 FlgK